MTFKTYKILDIMILTLIAILAEGLGIGATRIYFEAQSPLSFIISLAIPVILILLIRWNYYGLIAAFLVGITNHLVLGSGDISHLIIYCFGNLGIVTSVLLFKVIGKKQIKNDWIKTTLYYLVGYISVIVLRSMIAMLFGNHFLETLLNMTLKGEMLSLVIGWIVILIARRQNHLMVDMKHYLLTLHKKDVNQDGL